MDDNRYIRDGVVHVADVRVTDDPRDRKIAALQAENERLREAASAALKYTISGSANRSGFDIQKMAQEWCGIKRQILAALSTAHDENESETL